MAYRPLTNYPKGFRQELNTSTGGEKGVNLLTAPELIDNGFATQMDNYFIRRPGELKKAGGRSKLFTPTATDQTQTTEDSTQNLGDASGNTYIAQQFQAGSTGTLGTIAFKKASVTGSDIQGSVTVYVTADSSNDPDTEGNALFTKTYTQTEWAALENDVDIFIGQVGVSVTASTKYWIVLKAGATDGSNYTSLADASSDTYANGLYKNSSDDSTWNAITGDLYFKTFIEVAEALTMLEKFNNTTYVYAHGNTVGYYSTSTTAAVPLKEDFTTTDKFSGARYGDFFFVCNGTDALYRIQPVLGEELITNGDFATGDLTGWTTFEVDTAPTVVSNRLRIPVQGTVGQAGVTQTVSITAGDDYVFGYEIVSIATGPIGNTRLTGGIAKPDIIEVSSSTTTHQYKIRAIGSTLSLGTQVQAGSADFDNITLKKITSDYEITEVTSAPSPKIVRVIKDRLFLGDVDDAESKTVWSNQDVDSDERKEWIPFASFDGGPTATSATDSGSTYAEHLGTLKDIVAVDNPNLGNVIMPIHEEGYYGFDLQINEALELVARVNFDKQGNGGNRGLDTPEGVFFVNNKGLFRVTEPGLEENVGELLGTDFWDAVDTATADIDYDTVNNRLLVTLDTDADGVNDTIIWRNQIEVIDERGRAISGWALGKYNLGSNAVIMRDGRNFYGGDNDGTVYHLFTGTDDDGSNITSTFKQEFRLGGVNRLNDLRKLIGKGLFSNGGDVDINIDIYDKDGTLTENREQLTVTMPASGNLQQTTILKDLEIPNFQRIIVEVTSTDQKAHTWTYIQLDTVDKGPNPTTLNLTTV